VAFARTAPEFRGLHLIEGAGHWVQFEAPEAFDAVLQRVLQSDSNMPLAQAGSAPAAIQNIA
jgi:hypothetical protein